MRNSATVAYEAFTRFFRDCSAGQGRTAFAAEFQVESDVDKLAEFLEIAEPRWILRSQKPSPLAGWGRSLPIARF
jgi:hypothetical protein